MLHYKMLTILFDLIFSEPQFYTTPYVYDTSIGQPHLTPLHCHIRPKWKYTHQST